MPNNKIEFATRRELWEFVLSFEEGSLPPAAWNERTIAAVAVWYLSMLVVDEAVARLEAAVQRNRRRFRRRAGGSRDDVADLSVLWPRILQHVVTAGSAGDPLPLANRLLRERGTVLAARVA